MQLTVLLLTAIAFSGLKVSASPQRTRRQAQVGGTSSTGEAETGPVLEDGAQLRQFPECSTSTTETEEESTNVKARMEKKSASPETSTVYLPVTTIMPEVGIRRRSVDKENFESLAAHEINIQKRSVEDETILYETTTMPSEMVLYKRSVDGENSLPQDGLESSMKESDEEIIMTTESSSSEKTETSEPEDSEQPSALTSEPEESVESSPETSEPEESSTDSPEENVESENSSSDNSGPEESSEDSSGQVESDESTTQSSMDCEQSESDTSEPLESEESTTETSETITSKESSEVCALEEDSSTDAEPEEESSTTPEDGDSSKHAIFNRSITEKDSVTDEEISLKSESIIADNTLDNEANFVETKYEEQGEILQRKTFPGLSLLFSKSVEPFHPVKYSILEDNEENIQDNFDVNHKNEVETTDESLNENADINNLETNYKENATRNIYTLKKHLFLLKMVLGIIESEWEVRGMGSQQSAEKDLKMITESF